MFFSCLKRIQGWKVIVDILHVCLCGIQKEYEYTLVPVIMNRITIPYTRKNKKSAGSIAL